MVVEGSVIAKPGAIGTPSPDHRDSGPRETRHRPSGAPHHDQQYYPQLSPPPPGGLVRPRSVDDLLGRSSSGSTSSVSSGRSSAREPILEDLAESEVFVGMCFMCR